MWTRSRGVHPCCFEGVRYNSLHSIGALWSVVLLIVEVYTWSNNSFPKTSLQFWRQQCSGLVGRSLDMYVLIDVISKPSPILADERDSCLAEDANPRHRHTNVHASIRNKNIGVFGSNIVYWCSGWTRAAASNSYYCCTPKTRFNRKRRAVRRAVVKVVSRIILDFNVGTKEKTAVTCWRIL